MWMGAPLSRLRCVELSSIFSTLPIHMTEARKRNNKLSVAAATELQLKCGTRRPSGELLSRLPLRERGNFFAFLHTSARGTGPCR